MRIGRQHAEEPVVPPGLFGPGNKIENRLALLCRAYGVAEQQVGPAAKLCERSLSNAGKRKDDE